MLTASFEKMRFTCDFTLERQPIRDVQIPPFKRLVMKLAQCCDRVLRGILNPGYAPTRKRAISIDLGGGVS